ncbi:MAG: (2Fe-2S) ferredoxin domain-containing protein [bacterium]|nr:(2Fe-2S) ferredoxin domain-containing protein [bacterium]
MTERPQRLEKIASALSIGGLRRHIFLCAQQTNPRCSSFEESVAAWRRLKSATKALDIASAPPHWQGDLSRDPVLERPGNGTVLRSKVDCLRICEQGPIAVVYPDGVWYHSVAGEVLDRIVHEHLVGGRPVTEYMFAVDNLGTVDPG